MALWIQGNGAAGRESLLVRRLIDQGIRDPRVLAAMGEVPRHTFVDPAFLERAYGDHALPTAEGQTISQPWIVARMLELLDVGADEAVMVGDTIDDDIEGARAIGMRAVLLDREGRYPDVDGRLDDLRELPAALGLDT